jgi:excisionase family DNA binding protein
VADQVNHSNASSALGPRLTIAKGVPRRHIAELSRDATEPPEPKRALTVNEAVRLYSISRSGLYLLIKNREIPDVVVAGRRLIPRDAMERLIAGVRS